MIEYNYSLFILIINKCLKVFPDFMKICKDISSEHCMYTVKILQEWTRHHFHVQLVIFSSSAFRPISSQKYHFLLLFKKLFLPNFIMHLIGIFILLQRQHFFNLYASIQTQLILNSIMMPLILGSLQHIENWIFLRICCLWPTNELQRNLYLLLILSSIKIQDHMNGFKLWNSSNMYSHLFLFLFEYTLYYMFSGFQWPWRFFCKLKKDQCCRSHLF